MSNKKISIRSMICAPKGKTLVSVDLSQAENWIVAYLAKEQNMIWSLNNSDIHTDTASALFFDKNYCQHVWIDYAGGKLCTKCSLEIVKTARYIGKRYNHAKNYRMKAPKAAAVINKDSDKPPYVTVTLKESQMYSDRWEKKYNVKTWWSEIEAQLNVNRTISTVYGRKHMFFDRWGDELFRKATAEEPQSTVADHFNGAIQPELGIKGGLREIRNQLIVGYQDRAIIQQGHDSCIVEVPSSDARETALEMQRLLKRPLIIKDVQFTIPVDGEIGGRWGEMERVS